jgi:hypothetical protein
MLIFPLSFIAAKRVAYDEYARLPDKVASYLVHCTGQRDMYRTLRELRRNAPDLFIPRSEQ